MPTPRDPDLSPLVVAVAHQRVSLFACATGIFGLPRPEVGPGWYRFETCSLTGKPGPGDCGVHTAGDGWLEQLPKAGTVIIPAWHDIEAPVPTLGAATGVTPADWLELIV